MTFLLKSGAGYSGDHTDSVVPLVADLALNNAEALACGIDRSLGLGFGKKLHAGSEQGHVIRNDSIQSSASIDIENTYKPAEMMIKFVTEVQMNRVR